MSNISQENRRKQTADEVHNVWNAVDDLRTDVSSIKSSQASLVAKFDQVFEMFRQINGDRKTPWGIIISAIGVLIVLATALGGAALAPLYLNDSHQSSRHQEIIGSLRDHMSQDGHPMAMQKHAAMEKDVERLDGDVTELKDQIVNLDEVLQREMRVLDDIQVTRLDNLDATLQREMRMLQDLQDAKRESVEDRVEANTTQAKKKEDSRFEMPDYERLVKPTLDSMDSRTRDLETRQAERLSAIEAMLNKVMRDQEQRTRKVHGE